MGGAQCAVFAKPAGYSEDSTSSGVWDLGFSPVEEEGRAKLGLESFLSEADLYTQP